MCGGGNGGRHVKDTPWPATQPGDRGPCFRGEFDLFAPWLLQLFYQHQRLEGLGYAWPDRAQSERPHKDPAYDGRKVQAPDYFTKRMVCGVVPPPIRSATLEANSAAQTVFGAAGSSYNRVKPDGGPEMKCSGSGGQT